MSELMSTQTKEAAKKLDSLSEVLLEHIVDFDGKLEEVMVMFETTIEQIVERKVEERMERFFKELDRA